MNTYKVLQHDSKDLKAVKAGFAWLAIPFITFLPVRSPMILVFAFFRASIFAGSGAARTGAVNTAPEKDISTASAVTLDKFLITCLLNCLG